ncbi:hypothetical protein ACWGHU_24640 [Streptomyces xanthophaeus]
MDPFASTPVMSLPEATQEEPMSKRGRDLPVVLRSGSQELFDPNWLSLEVLVTERQNADGDQEFADIVRRMCDLEGVQALMGDGLAGCGQLHEQARGFAAVEPAE